VRTSGGTITRTQSRVFDEMSRLIRDVGAASQITAYGYDKNSNLTSVTDPLTHASVFAFDALDRLITVTNAAGGQTQQAWDPQDNQTGFTDPGGVTTSFVHDGFGQVIQEAGPDGGTIVYERDAAGNVTRVTDGRGVVADLTYDALNRVLTRTYSSAPAQNITYRYDEATGVYGIGRLTGWTDVSGGTSLVYDARGNVTQSTRVIGTQSYVTQYTWTLADLPASVTYPTGRIVSYTRDALGRVTAVSQKDNAAAAVRTVADSITWQPFGALAGLRHANSVEMAFTYDLDSRLSRILATGGATTFLDLNYTWDTADNITAIADARVPAQSQSFGYDTLDRLISGTGAYGAWTYGYSANSNRTARSKSGGVSETYTTTSGTNRLASVSDGSNTRSLTYDGAGNITSDARSPSQTFTYVYDKAGRLTEVQLAAQTWALYQLNALGERVAKTIPGTPDQVTHFHYDLDGRLIAETDGSGAMLREYIWLDELPVMFRAGAAEYAVLTDHLATPNRLVDLAGTVVWDAVWRPFGELESLTATVTFPLRLPGQYFDAETGLHYNYQRDYDPALGRYIQADPIGLVGGANRYGYVGGNPLIRADPLGLMPSHLFKGHHWFSRQQFRPGNPEKWNFTPEARNVFERSTSGRLPPGYNYYDTSHREYNKAVGEHVKRWMAERQIQPHTMTAQQAEQCIRSIKGSEDPKIKPFVRRTIMGMIRYQMMQMGSSRKEP
jgi:RHS repeat-associated protein